MNQTAFLIDYSGGMSSTQLLKIARDVTRRFSPGDCVIGFDHRASAVSFVGNPTISDIIRFGALMAGGTNIRFAIEYAKSIVPNADLVVFSDGEFEDVSSEFNYELVKV